MSEQYNFTYRPELDPPEKKSHRLRIFLGAVAFTGLAAGAGYFYFDRMHENEPQPAVEQVTPSPTTS